MVVYQTVHSKFNVFICLHILVIHLQLDNLRSKHPKGQWGHFKRSYKRVCSNHAANMYLYILMKMLWVPHGEMGAF